MRGVRWILTLTLALAFSWLAGADTHVCILRGLGGDAAMETRFQDWSARLAKALSARCDIPEAQIHAFPDLSGDSAAPLTREGAAAALGAFAGRVQPEDTFFLVLIGHGSFQQEAKFMVEGPDIAAGEFGVWLDAIPAARQVIVNTASSSAAFINALSAPGRIIATSTHSGAARNAPEFMEHLVTVLEEGRGDANRDGEVTLAETLDAAAASTLAWFESEGYIVTEYALLDDNGDGRGARLPLESGAEEGDGAQAAALVLQRDPLYAMADPEALARYRAAIDAVKAHTALKETLEREAYWAQLEQLLLDAARLHRELLAPAPATPDTPATPETP